MTCSILEKKKEGTEWGKKTTTPWKKERTLINTRARYRRAKNELRGNNNMLHSYPFWATLSSLLFPKDYLPLVNWRFELRGLRRFNLSGDKKRRIGDIFQGRIDESHAPRELVFLSLFKSCFCRPGSPLELTCALKGNRVVPKWGEIC